MNKAKRLIVMAGGTGGHVFSGLVVAQYLMKQGWQICWLGTADHIEANLVPRYGITINFIRISSLRGKGFKALLYAPIHILNAWRQAYIVMRSFKPDVALGMGGYVSGPSGLAAWSLRIPIILHEQNGIAGLTNKWLNKIANKAMQAYPEVFPKAKTVGNPVRTEILSIPQPEVRFMKRTGPIRILVMGGSQGAYIFNKLMPQVAKKLDHMVTIWHQVGFGKDNLKNIKQIYKDIGKKQHKITEFIDNVAEAYAWADIIICRAGALTVSEIMVVGVPALFVPFQHRDRHQYVNAKPLERVGAAKILDQSKFNVDTVVAILLNWKQRTTLLKMAKLARNLAAPNATKKIAEEINLMISD